VELNEVNAGLSPLANDMTQTRTLIGIFRALSREFPSDQSLRAVPAKDSNFAIAKSSA